MADSLDRLYDLLPRIHRLRDCEQGEPLRALLQVIAEQVNVVEADIDQLYENWFIETCQDWVVPYIGSLIGYQPVHTVGETEAIAADRTQQRSRILIPRREVANTLRYRRRKGTLALLELLAADVSGWTIRAVEFYKLLGWTQSLNHLRLRQGATIDLRQQDGLDRLDTPFDELAHTIDVRRIASPHDLGRYNLPDIGIFVWRLKAYPVADRSSQSLPAAFRLDRRPTCHTFSILGNDIPLYTYPQRETEPTQIASELNVPTPIRRRAFEQHLADYYGADKSLYLYESPGQPISIDRIVAADLSNWHYRPLLNQVAVDPELGRIVFHPRRLPKDLRVFYYYGFSADIGGGIYERSLSPIPVDRRHYQVTAGTAQERPLHEAVMQWQQDQPSDAVIEIADSGVYPEQINITLAAHQRLEIRAAAGCRPVIRLLNIRANNFDDLIVTGAPGSRFYLDGLLISGRGIRLVGSLREVVIRHTTLVPGWELEESCEPRYGSEPSLTLTDSLLADDTIDRDTQPTEKTEGYSASTRLRIEHSIIGTIAVIRDEVQRDPDQIQISDSIVDATSSEIEALSGSDGAIAHAVLTIARSTVIGKVWTHAIWLAENTIFDGLLRVARTQIGCMRFCYYLTPGSRTPRRYNCQPDLVVQAVRSNAVIPTEEQAAIEQTERDRVRPQFNSTRYGTPTYVQIAQTCADEIKRGADDESEIGVFHDLYQPQRAANLRSRLDEYTPAGSETGIIYAS